MSFGTWKHPAVRVVMEKLKSRLMQERKTGSAPRALLNRKNLIVVCERSLHGGVFNVRM